MTFRPQSASGGAPFSHPPHDAERSVPNPQLEADATGKPNRNPWQCEAVKLQRRFRESDQVTTYELEFCDPLMAAKYQFSPGQFNMLYVPGVGEAAISIAGRIKGTNRLLHTIRSVGSVTRALEAAAVGSRLGLRGPFGASWPLSSLLACNAPRDIVVVAGGIGLAPLRALIDSIVEKRAQFGRVHVLLGARTPDEFLYKDSFEGWRRAQIDVQTTVDRPHGSWQGHVGVVTLLLERISIDNPTNTTILTCGPEVMMRYVARTAKGRGIIDADIWVTLERNMNCAIGLCGHCQLGPAFLCKDGPVFRFDQVQPWLQIRDL